LRHAFQDRPFVLIDRDFGLLGELVKVVRLQLVVQLVLGVFAEFERSMIRE
jgi:hypothetical protein